MDSALFSPWNGTYGNEQIPAVEQEPTMPNFHLERYDQPGNSYRIENIQSNITGNVISFLCLPILRFLTLGLRFECTAY